MFRYLPADTGHFGVPYYEHVLRGLRRHLPDYIVSTADGNAPPEWLSDLLGRIVLFDVS